MSFVSTMTIPQLGLGAGYALWGFRAAAVGQIECPALVRGYRRLFEKSADDALSAVLVFARTIGSEGVRRIGLGVPGCCGVTSDELSIAAVLSAAQAEDTSRRDAHLLWLLGCTGDGASARAADDVAAAFLVSGLVIEQPPVELQSNPNPRTESNIVRTLHVAGNA
ncbi:MAG: hypothetical protein AAF224_08915 [Pseudomonadota bacterium]